MVHILVCIPVRPQSDNVDTLNNQRSCRTDLADSQDRLEDIGATGPKRPTSHQMSAKPAEKAEIGDDAEYIGGLVKRVGNFRAGAYANDLDERKQFQKTVYLMQAFGIKLGYNFRWYIHGPYSSPLADVGYEISKHYKRIQELYFSDPDVSRLFEQYLSFMDGIKDDLEALEIAASLHFLWVRNQDMQRDLIIEWLQSEKDLESSSKEIEDMWYHLEKQGIIES